MRLKKKAELKINSMKQENETLHQELNQVLQEKGVSISYSSHAVHHSLIRAQLLQIRIKELEGDISRFQDKLLEKQNEFETYKLQHVARSVSPSKSGYPRSPSPPRYGANDTSLVTGERERSPTKYNRSFEELKAKLEGKGETGMTREPREVEINRIIYRGKKRGKKRITTIAQ